MLGNLQSRLFTGSYTRRSDCKSRMWKLFSKANAGCDTIYLKTCSVKIPHPVIGQKQRWFFLRLLSDQTKINFKCTDTPEFDAWEWVNYWYPISAVVSFKKNVYRQALVEFSQINAGFERSK